MVYRFQLTYDEVTDILDLKDTPTKRIGYSIPTGMYEIIDIDFIFKNLLLKEVKVDIKIDDVRLKSNLNFYQTSIFTKNSFFRYDFGLCSILFRRTR